MQELINNFGYTLFAVLAFLVAFGVLVTVHEFGHFVAARLCGVLVLRFSVGMGKPLWTRPFGEDQTDFVLAAWPLGGYVLMLDERLLKKIPPSLLHRALNRRPVRQRVLIALAGPLANLLLAALLFMLAYLVGIPGVRPIIGGVLPDSPAAAAGLQSGLEIRTVEGDPTPTWKSAVLRLIDAYEERGRITLRAGDADYEQEFSLEVGDLGAGKLVEQGVPEALGLRLQGLESLPADIGEVIPGDPAALAGIRPGDLVTAVDERPVHNWQGFTEALDGVAGQPVVLDVRRDGRDLRFTMTPAPGTVADGSRRGFIGVRPDPAAWQEQQRRNRVLERYSPWGAAERGLQETVLSVVLTGRFLAWLFSGQVSVRHLSGPVGIARISGLSARRGLGFYLYFLALFSVNLGLLNLLPIPPLDGAHVVCSLLEGMRRGRPVPEKVMNVSWIVGWGLMLGLLLFVSYNDLLNLGLF